MLCCDTSIQTLSFSFLNSKFFSWNHWNVCTVLVSPVFLFHPKSFVLGCYKGFQNDSHKQKSIKKPWPPQSRLQKGCFPATDSTTDCAESENWRIEGRSWEKKINENIILLPSINSRKLTYPTLANGKTIASKGPNRRGYGFAVNL